MIKPADKLSTEFALLVQLVKQLRPVEQIARIATEELEKLIEYKQLESELNPVGEKRLVDLKGILSNEYGETPKRAFLVYIQLMHVLNCFNALPNRNKRLCNVESSLKDLLNELKEALPRTQSEVVGSCREFVNIASVVEILERALTEINNLQRVPEAGLDLENHRYENDLVTYQDLWDIYTRKVKAMEFQSFTNMLNKVGNFPKPVKNSWPKRFKTMEVRTWVKEHLHFDL